MRLHGYWRSGTSYRVRIALALKGLAYEQAAYDLRRGDQHGPDYRALNPQPLVPALELDDGTVLTQSPAILEWLEDTCPTPPLLPADPAARAIVRAMAALIGCDIHPLNNLRVLNALRTDLAADENVIQPWIERRITDGFTALEPLIARYGRGAAFGELPTLADCYLVPQVYSAERFGVALGAYPRLMAAVETIRARAEITGAHPDRQPDAAAP